MRFELITDVNRLQGTWYYEFLPGLFKEQRWNWNSVFIDGDAFIVIEGAFCGSVPNFARYGPSTASGRVIERLARELRALEKAVGAAGGPAEVEAWDYFDAIQMEGLADWPTARPRIRRMLDDLRHWLLAMRAADRSVNILGL